MRISDWSSDVCSSDLAVAAARAVAAMDRARRGAGCHARAAAAGRRYRCIDRVRAAAPGRHAVALAVRAVRVCRVAAAGSADRFPAAGRRRAGAGRSEEHTSELQSLMRISYAVFCLKKTKLT